MSMQEIAGFLLSGNNVMEDITKTSPSEEMISVRESVSGITEKRKRGRPPKAGGAMTVAERARRYRQKHRPARQGRRVDLGASTVERAEKIAAETGRSVASVIHLAVYDMDDDESIRLHPSPYTFKQAKAAAATVGVPVEYILSSALGYISDAQWIEIEESWIRFEAEK
jgi:hypothetical protein